MDPTEPQTKNPSDHNPEPRGKSRFWFLKKKDRDWIDLLGALSVSLGILGIFVATGFYIYDRIANVSLEVTAPLVIEFRCSTQSFAPDFCFHRDEIHQKHLSMTAALRFDAIGPSIKNIRIISASADVSYPLFKEKISLTAFWTGRFTGGKGDFVQIVQPSIAGGEALIQEIWFMPLTEPPACIALNKSECKSERKNFHLWPKFIEDLKTLYNNAVENQKAISIGVTLKVNWGKTLDEVQTTTLECTLPIGYSIYKQAHLSVEKPIYVTIPAKCEKKKLP